MDYQKTYQQGLAPLIGFASLQQCLSIPATSNSFFGK